MGLEHSKPLTQLTHEEVASTVEKLGKHYSEAAKSIRDNAVDGAFLDGLSPTEIEETLDDLGIENRLHRRVLEKKLAAAQQEAQPQVVCSFEDVSELYQPKVGLRRTNTMETCGSRSVYTSRTSRTQRSQEEKEAATKKAMELLTAASEQEMLERFALLNRENDLRHQIQMCSTNQAA